ncbi:hypothetical protein ABH926_003722 [Catenulispora sp. GP43]|uniref:hypothetical protein n=1 Tax=Catenulispora sp. GP43 TaxID=3156263 RepID=UPI003513C54E
MNPALTETEAASPFTAAHLSLVDPDHEVSALRRSLGEVPFTWDSHIPLAPIVLRRELYRAMTDSAVRILDLLDDAARRLGRTPAERLRALGVDPEPYLAENPFFLDDRGESDLAACLARPDVLITEQGPKFIEFNVSASIGGMVQTHLLTGLWGAGASAAAAAAAAAYPEPLSAVAALLVRLSRDLGTDPTVAVLGITEHYARPSRAAFQIEAAHLRRNGVDARVFDPDELATELARRRGFGWRTALRRNGAFRWRSSPFGTRPLTELISRGCLLLAPQSSYILADKRLLADLSAGPEWMSQASQELVAARVPWTRRVAAGPVTYQDHDEDLPNLLAKARTRFVLKRATGRAGTEVCVGRATAPAAWEAAIGQAVRAGDWVVQEYLQSCAAKVPLADMRSGEVDVVSVTPVLGPFIIDGSPAGCYVRHTGGHDTHVISASTSQALRNIALEGRA